MFLSAGIFLTLKLWRIKQNGIVTKARITYSQEDLGGLNIYPEYEFFDYKGNLIRVKAALSIFNFQQKLVNIIYDKGDPTRVMPYNFLVMNGPYLVIIIGVAFILYTFLPH